MLPHSFVILQKLIQLSVALLEWDLQAKTPCLLGFFRFFILIHVVGFLLFQDQIPLAKSLSYRL